MQTPTGCRSRELYGTEALRRRLLAVCTLITGRPVAEVQFRLLCCIADVAGTLHV